MNPASTQSGYVLVIACMIDAKNRYSEHGNDP